LALAQKTPLVALAHLDRRHEHRPDTALRVLDDAGLVCGVGAADAAFRLLWVEVLVALRVGEQEVDLAARLRPVERKGHPLEAIRHKHRQFGAADAHALRLVEPHLVQNRLGKLLVDIAQTVGEQRRPDIEADGSETTHGVAPRGPLRLAPSWFTGMKSPPLSSAMSSSRLKKPALEGPTPTVVDDGVGRLDHTLDGRRVIERGRRFPYRR
jgi:hypothetical protein